MALEVLLARVQHEPSLLRQFLLQQRPECSLLHALVKVLVSSSSSGEKPQATEVLRSILDPDGLCLARVRVLAHHPLTHPLPDSVRGHASASSARCRSA